MNYYNKYIKYKNKYNNLKKKRNLIMTGGSQQTEVYLFKADWCPHCQAFLPTWDALNKQYSSKYSFIKYDDKKNANIIKEWDIKGFPTIVIKKGNRAMEYMGPKDFNSVLEFIKSV